jgi:hypothetical protein
MDRAVEHHKRAEREFEVTVLGRRVLPYLRPAYSVFWDWAIDDAIGKGLAAIGKWMMRDKGRTVVLFRRHAKDPRPYLDSLVPLQTILASLREPGRPSKAPFHDLVTFAYLVTRGIGATDRRSSLKLLRHFLEFPELGYALGPGDITRIAYRVIGTSCALPLTTDYPLTVEICCALDPTLKRPPLGSRPALAAVRKGGLQH